MTPRSSSFDLDAVLAEAPHWAEVLEEIVASKKGSISNARGYKASIVKGWLSSPNSQDTPPREKRAERLKDSLAYIPAPAEDAVTAKVMQRLGVAQ